MRRVSGFVVCSFMRKMYAGFHRDSNILGQAAVLYSGQKGITFGVIIISQPVDMFLEVSFPDKTGQCILFEIDTVQE